MITSGKVDKRRTRESPGSPTVSPRVLQENEDSLHEFVLGELKLTGLCIF
jgi:hypothetical protein